MYIGRDADLAGLYIYIYVSQNGSVASLSTTNPSDYSFSVVTQSTPIGWRFLFFFNLVSHFFSAAVFLCLRST